MDTKVRTAVVSPSPCMGMYSVPSTKSGWSLFTPRHAVEQVVKGTEQLVVAALISVCSGQQDFGMRLKPLPDERVLCPGLR